MISSPITSTNAQKIERAKAIKNVTWINKDLAQAFKTFSDPRNPRFLAEGEILIHEELPDDSFARQLVFRPGNYIVRSYSPSGITRGGLYVEKNTRWPRVWGHILCCAVDNIHNLVPGQLVMFVRHSEDKLGEDKPVVEQYPGEKLPVEILNYKAIVAVIHDAPVQVRF